MSVIVISSLVLISSLLISHVLSPQSGPAATNCPGTPQPLITGDIYRVEDDQFSASSSYSRSYPPHGARINSGSWCSVADHVEHWVQVDFGANVIIHELQIGGKEGTLQSSTTYVTKFRVEYGPTSSQLMPIRDRSNEVMTFTRPNTYAVTDIRLPAPIPTRVLRIVTVDQNPLPCLTIEAKGCVQSPACQVDERLSTERSLLPLSSIRASSALAEYPARYVVHPTPENILTVRKAFWCTDERLSESSPLPYITFSFTERVVLTYMIARGVPPLLYNYVTKFSLDYKVEDSEDFTPYTLLTQEEAVFSTGSYRPQTYTFWKQPLEGRTFRFKIKEWRRASSLSQTQRFCWNVQLHGCRAAGQELTPTTESPLTFTTNPINTQETPTQSTVTMTTAATTETTTKDGSTQETPTTSTVTMTTAGTMETNTTDGITAAPIELVAGVAGGGAIIIFAVFLLFIAVCLILVARKRATHKLTEVKYTESGEVRIANNETVPSSGQIDEDEDTGDYESIGSPGATPPALVWTPVIRAPCPYETPIISSYMYEPVDVPTNITSRQALKPSSLQREDISRNKRQEGPVRITTNPAYTEARAKRMLNVQCYASSPTPNVR